jgi:hypothetical protein
VYRRQPREDNVAHWLATSLCRFANFCCSSDAIIALSVVAEQSLICAVVCKV